MELVAAVGQVLAAGCPRCTGLGVIPSVRVSQMDSPECDPCPVCEPLRQKLAEYEQMRKGPWPR